MDYHKARQEAQAQANRYGFDFGLESSGDGFRIFMLPRRENRSGHELRCEVVSPERLANCRDGHGPMVRP